jgi:DNA polymerase-3 subunit alpha
MLLNYSNVDTLSINDKKDRETVIFGGVVSNIREVTTKKKDVMAYITIEDLKGSVTVIFFADIYRSSFSLLHSDEPVLIKGTIDAGEEGIKVIASELTALANAGEKPFNSVHFFIDVLRSSPDDILLLNRLLSKHSGDSDGYIHIINGRTEVVIFLGKESRFKLSNHLKEETDRLFGEGSTHFAYTD